MQTYFDYLESQQFEYRSNLGPGTPIPEDQRDPPHLLRIGDELISLAGLDHEESIQAVCDAVDVALASGQWSGFQFGDRPVSNVEMYAFKIWREQSMSSLVEQWANQLLTWLGVSSDEYRTGEE